MKIVSLTHLGLGRAEDGTLIPRVLAGEQVERGPDGAVRILTPSSHRVAAPCRHYRTCGGCAMQHASEPFVAEWKAGIVRRALSAQGIEAVIGPVVTSPPRSRRRAKLSGQRTKKGAMVGFHTHGSNQLVAVPDCQLLLPSLIAALPGLEALTVLAASRKSEIGLTVTDSMTGPDIRVETERELTPQLRVELAALAQKFRFSRLVWQDEQVVSLKPPTQQFGSAIVIPPPGAFLQATREGEAALLAAVRHHTAGAARIADLFSGCGTFALPLAAAAEVHAVEGDAAMLAALDRGWREAKGLRRVTNETRDLFRRPLEPDELARFDAVVIDPPRAGAEAQVDALARSTVRRIAMVSCNPVTFARDAARLAGAGYAISEVTVVDQFRWSAHVELVAGFART